MKPKNTGCFYPGDDEFARSLVPGTAINIFWFDKKGNIEVVWKLTVSYVFKGAHEYLVCTNEHSQAYSMNRVEIA